jgi:hypothetical protein
MSARLEKHQGRMTMRRAWLLLAGLAVAPLSVLAQTMDFAKVEILTEKLGPNVYMLSGSIPRTRTAPAAASACSPVPMAC